MIHYVEEELMLEQLHQIRRRKVFDSNSSDSAHGSVDRRDRFEGAGLILKHIHFIYGRMCRKFGRKERSVWFSYIEFCKGHTDISKVGNDSDSDSDSETTNPNPSPSFDNHNISGRKLLSKLYAEALQLHPLTAAFWIEAASFEAFSKGNFDSARSILQRAVRVNRNHAANMRIIWVEMVKLECGFVEVTNGRREFAKKRKRLPDESDKDDAGDLTVPLIVLKNAVNHARSSSSSSSSSHTADSNNIAFYASLLQIVSNQFKHLDTTSILTNFVTNALTTDFHSSPKAVLVRADFERSVNNDLAAFSVLMDGIEACRGSNNLALSEMLRLSAEFIWDCLVDMNDKDVVVVKDVKKVESMYKKLLVDASKEAVGGGFDSRLCLLLMEFYRDVEEDEGKAKSVAEQFLKGGGGSGSEDWWGAYANLCENEEQKIEVLQKGIKLLNGGAVLSTMLINLLIEKNNNNNGIEEIILKANSSTERGILCMVYLKKAKERSAASIIEFVLNSVPAGPGLIVFLEKALEQTTEIGKRRKLWESILSNCEKNDDSKLTWLTKWEEELQSLGDFNGAAVVANRRTN